MELSYSYSAHEVNEDKKGKYFPLRLPKYQKGESGLK
jgi:hypothetical protein